LNTVSTNNSLNCEIDPTNYYCSNEEKYKFNNELGIDWLIYIEKWQNPLIVVNNWLDECECNKHGSYSLGDKLCNTDTKQCNCKPGKSQTIRYYPSLSN